MNRILKNVFSPAIILILFCLLSVQLQAGPRGAPKEPIVFENPQVESDYLELAEELRCLVCQNQNLIDSNAELADDLRREVAKMLKKGQTKEQVKDFMVDRYGDFVLYNPPFKAQTLLLWGGPFVLMFWGLFAMLKKIKADKAENSGESLTLSDEEKEKLQDILKNN
jgi:cytochrome c-type biogenesis protein CcmH